MSGAAFPLIRPLAVPVEHGAWSFLLEPIALGLIIAPSGDGVLIGIGMLAVFLLRQPLKLMIRDWTRRRYPRTALCEGLVAAYALAAAVTFGVAFSRALLPLLVAVPFGVAQFIYDYRNQNRTLISELCGAIASVPVVAAIVLAGGKPPALAGALAAIVLSRAVPAVLYVRSVLRGESRALMITAHAIAVGVTAIFSWTAALAAALLLARAIPPMRSVRAQTVGMREIAWGAMFVVLCAVGFY